MAAEYRRPIIIHCVRAYGTLVEQLQQIDGPLPPVVVLHAFGGSAEIAQQCLRLPTRVFFGFSPLAARLKRSAAGARAYNHRGPSILSSDVHLDCTVMAVLPTDRLLIESDEHSAIQASQLIPLRAR